MSEVGTAADMSQERLGRVLHAWAGGLEAGSLSVEDVVGALRNCADDLIAGPNTGTRHQFTPCTAPDLHVPSGHGPSGPECVATDGAWGCARPEDHPCHSVDPQG